jgi:hypothetical protein
MPKEEHEEPPQRAERVRPGRRSTARAEEPITASVPAEVGADGTLSGPKPPAGARAYFFTATTPAGLAVSSPAVVAPDR